MLAFRFITLLVLGTIAWEDLRERSIHWWLLPVLAIAMLVPAWVELPMWELGAQMGFNLLFLGMQLGGLLLFVVLRNRGWVDPVNRYIGSGDLYFFLVLALGLSSANFVLFYLSGLALCIPAYLLLVKLWPATERTVPTAGFLALYLMLWCMVDLFCNSCGLFTGSMAENLLGHAG
ncbi:MAG: hypothetical protein KDC00_11115 [Flavobacteriales bacterium]|nr:hypothetical protein [Flavobacteriales bacterium]